MGERPTLDPMEARASLDQVDESRRAAVKAGRRPVGIDLGMAAVVGFGVWLGLAGQGIAALAILLAGSAAVVILQRRLTRRRGQVFDQRAVGARMWRFALLYLVLVLLTMIEPPLGWQPWFAIGVGVVAGAGAFAWLRWENRYQLRRLADGDYDRYDLL
jgi:Flp pilus assembly protein TadB